LIFSLYPDACDLYSESESETSRRKTKRFCDDDGGVGEWDCERGKESVSSEAVF